MESVKNLDRPDEQRRATTSIEARPASRRFAPVAAIAATVLSVAGVIRRRRDARPRGLDPDDRLVLLRSLRCPEALGHPEQPRSAGVAALRGVLRRCDPRPVRFATAGGDPVLRRCDPPGGWAFPLGRDLRRPGWVDRTDLRSASQAISVVGIVVVFFVTLGTSAFMLGAGAATLVRGLASVARVDGFEPRGHRRCAESRSRGRTRSHRLRTVRRVAGMDRRGRLPCRPPGVG